MPFFDATTKRFALRIGLPAILILLATIATVLVSLARMAGEVNSVEERLTERSATAAIQSTLRNFGETAHDYAQWDDAVRNLYGAANVDWAKTNIISSTSDATLFDTFYLVDEDGNELLAYRDGEPIAASATGAFGPSLAWMIAGLPKDGKTFGVKTGTVKGAWGLALVAVAPVVPEEASFPNPPHPARFLVIGKSFDDSVVQRLRDDFLINGLHFADPAVSNSPEDQPR